MQSRKSGRRVDKIAFSLRNLVSSSLRALTRIVSFRRMTSSSAAMADRSLCLCCCSLYYRPFFVMLLTSDLMVTWTKLNIQKHFYCLGSDIAVPFSRLVGD